MNQHLPPFAKSENSSLKFKKEERSNVGLRFYTLPLLCAFTILLLSARLFQLTVVKGSYYRYIAENNRIKEISVPAIRGTVTDRKGVPLVTSGLTGDTFVRTYHSGEAIGHFAGFIQLASKKDISEDACPDTLGLNDWIGKKGIEKTYECLLRGTKGKKLVEIDAHGQHIRTLSFTPPKTGKTIKVSLDSQLQEKAFQVLTQQEITNSGGTVILPEKRASVVATNPKTGEILVLLSTPSFDPNAFSQNNQSLIQAYLKDERKPLFTRALQGVYPPGSVYKPVMAVGALEDNVIDTSFTVEDTGVIKAGPSTFGNWYFLEYGKTEGTVDILKALKRSNDIFFYKLGEKMGDAKMKVWGERFGYGDKTGISLGEASGLVPSAFWKKEVVGERWFLGDTYNTSIGQGFLQVTPLQVNQSIATIVNGGSRCVPKLLKGEKPECTSLHLSEKTVKTVLEGMRQACAAGGTGWPFFDFKVHVGCKTGTAESHAASGLPHAWFTVFAPYEDPEIVVTVMVEESGQGSNVAAPIAKEILRTYFERSE